MATVSAWAKPGAWALDSEAHEAEEQHFNSAAAAAESTAEFPSLSAAPSTKSTYTGEFPSPATGVAEPKTSKKKKAQTLSLAEFAKQSFAAPDEALVLPTGPRERSAEELERGSRGFGFSSYGIGRGGGSGSRGNSDEMRKSREPSRDLGPSRADEIDDWAAAKKSVPERRERSLGFFDNPSRADESDSWASKKSSVNSQYDGRRRIGFETGNREGIDSDSWVKKRDDVNGERMSSRDGIDSDSWGRKRDDLNGRSSNRNIINSGSWGRKKDGIDSDGSSRSGGRPRLVLQPRTLPPTNGNGNVEQKELEQQQPKKGSNLFGQARPREEVLVEKGQDWKELDEKLESMKIREAPPESGRRGFGRGTAGRTDDQTERTWRKPAAVDAMDASSQSPRAEESEVEPAGN